MALKSIVCLLNGFEQEVTAVDAAFALAQANAGHVRLIHVSYPVYSYSGFFGEAVMVGGGWAEAFEEAATARREEARRIADAAAERAGVVYNPATVPSGEASASFSILENRTNDAIVRELSLCDLLVLGAEKGAADISDHSVTGLALFSSGRPLLVVRPKPEGVTAWSGRTCALAWNHSAEAIRAVISARDILRAADKVHVFVTEDPKRPLDAHENQVVMDYLAAHGVEAGLQAVPREGGSDAEAILKAVRNAGADVLLMGAYGHSVFRELLIGGFTAYMLEEAELPLVLAH